MKKLVVHTLASLDGVVEDPPAWGSRDYKDEESVRDDHAEVLAASAMLLGRGGYESLAPIFGPRKDPWATRINTMEKIVFSKTLRDTPWQNSRTVSADALGMVEELKSEDGGPLVVYGYTRLAESLLRSGLVDVLRVSLHPVLAGRGRQLFREGMAAKLELLSSKTYASGVVLVTYGKA